MTERISKRDAAAASAAADRAAAGGDEIRVTRVVSKPKEEVEEVRVSRAPSKLKEEQGEEFIIAEPTSPRGPSSASPRVRSSRLSERDLTEHVATQDALRDLESVGYVVIDKVVIPDVDGEIRMPLVRVTTPLGETAFVKLDRARILCSKKDLTYMQVSRGIVLPESWKNGTYKCAIDSSLAGAAFMNHNSICMVTHDSDPDKPRETNFIYTAKVHDRRIHIGENPIGYPVVRHAEIMARPALVAKMIHDVTVRIRKEVRQQVIEELKNEEKSTRASIICLQKSFESALAAVDHKLQWVEENKQLQEISDWQKYYIENMPCEEFERAKMRAMTRLLEQANALTVCTVGAAHAINLQRKEIDKAVANIQAIHKAMHTDYEALLAEMNKACGVPAAEVVVVTKPC